MESCNIEYVYRKSEEEELEETIGRLQEQLGGNRKPYHSRHGAIDLVSFLELLIIFTAGISVKPVLQKYFEGLLNADGLKKIGESHRKEITEWFLKLEKDIFQILDALHSSLSVLHTSFTFDGNEEAVVLEIPTYSGLLYVTLNHRDITPKLIKNLPEGIIKAVRFLCEKGFSGDTMVLQLYFDKQLQQWVYLLAPTVEGFGNFIDRYVDLRDGEIRYLASQSEFIQTFNPAPEDTLKFLVSPYWRDK